MKRWLAVPVAFAAIVLAWRQGVSAMAAHSMSSGLPFVAAFGLAVLAGILAAVSVRRSRKASRELNRLSGMVSATVGEGPGGRGAVRVPGAVAHMAADIPEDDVRHCEILLQPIVSLARNEAVAFDAVADAGAGGIPAGVEADRRFLLSVIREMALRPRELGGENLVFAAVSAEFLADPASRGFVAAALRGKPNVARGLRLRVAPAALAMLSGRPDLPVGLALDGASSSGGSVAGLTHVRLPAAALLHSRAERRLPALHAVDAAQSAGLAVIATGIESREDASRLADLGVDLVVGPGISPPLRLRPVGERPETVAGFRRASRRRQAAGLRAAGD